MLLLLTMTAPNTVAAIRNGRKSHEVNSGIEGEGDEIEEGDEWAMMKELEGLKDGVT